MDRKAILRDVSNNVRNNFWSYLSAVLILSLVSLICNGGFSILLQSQGALRAIRSGFFSVEQLTTLDSEFWSVVGSTPGLGFIGMIAVYFLVNPLAVRVNAFFLKGIDDKPEFKMLSIKDNYKNNVLVTFFSGILLEIIILSLFFAYTTVVGLLGGLFFSIDSPIAIVAGMLISTVLVVLLMIVLISVHYNFSLIYYILTENKNWGFGLVYMFSRKLVYKRKWKIFKLEFKYILGQTVAVMLPFILFFAGVISEVYGFDGRAIASVGLIIIVPAYCLYTFVSVYKNALWARIYSELRKELPDEEKVFSEYRPPENNENISYE